MLRYDTLTNYDSSSGVQVGGPAPHPPTPTPTPAPPPRKRIARPPPRVLPPDDELQLVGIAWISAVMGDRSLKSTRRWIERARAKRLLRPVPLPGRRLRFRRADVERLIRGGGVEGAETF